MTTTTTRMKKTLIGLSLSLALAAGGIAGLAPHQAYAATSTVTATTTMTAAAKAKAIIATGERFMGVPYRYGSPSGSTSTFDCSSFTQYIFKRNGILLPRSSSQQSHVGTYVPRSQLKPGDLVFFYSPIHHVGVYIGNGLILHTYGTPGVTISSMKTGWWSRHYTTARRVIH